MRAIVAGCIHPCQVSAGQSRVRAAAMGEWPPHVPELTETETWHNGAAGAALFFFPPILAGTPELSPVKKYMLRSIYIYMLKQSFARISPHINF
jgi:hypothetical protein